VGNLRRGRAATFVHVSNLFHIPEAGPPPQLVARHPSADPRVLLELGAEANATAIKLALNGPRSRVERSRRHHQHAVVASKAGPWTTVTATAPG